MCLGLLYYAAKKYDYNSVGWLCAYNSSRKRGYARYTFRFFYYCGAAKDFLIFINCMMNEWESSMGWLYIFFSVLFYSVMCWCFCVFGIVKMVILI